MTNTEIIFQERLELQKAGVIGGTGRKIEYEIINTEGEKEIRVFEEPEEIHTYAAWKEAGYQVKRGEKAIAKFTIWKYAKGKKDEDEEEAQQKGHMFLKQAAFFKASQVERITEDEEV